MGEVGTAYRGGAAGQRSGAQDLERNIAAIVLRHRNGATWRAIPAELGP